MPSFGFNRAFGLGQGAKAFFRGPGKDVTHGAAPNVERPEDRAEGAEGAKPGAPGRRKKLRKLRKRLSKTKEERFQVAEELRGAKLAADKSEVIEQTKKMVSKRQEVFEVKRRARAVKRGQDPETAIGALPDFVVIGAPKCGTTFFYHLLAKHPYVEPSAFKELHYFDLLFQEDVEWYRRCFTAPQWRNGRKTITGESTPAYLAHPHVPERMAEVVPQARLIALLRNPVDRTYSAYHHRAKNTPQRRTFEETVEAELLSSRQGYVSRSIYVDQLRRWSKFFDDGQMLVLKSEDFFENPRDTMKLALGFLDLPDWEPTDSVLGKKVNKGKYGQTIDPATRQRLEEYFESHNQRLYEYLGVDFGW